MPTSQEIVQAAKAAVGKTIADFCGNGFVDPDLNHCAHFVCHICKLDFDMTCKKLTGGSKAGSNVRCQELFAKAPQVGKWADADKTKVQLIFATAAGNVDLENHTMANVPKKHVGIYTGSKVIHYGNSTDKVVTDTPETFLAKFKASYGADTALFFGTIPGQTVNVSSTDVVIRQDGSSYFATIAGKPEFYVGNKTTYLGKVGLYMPGSKYYGPTYSPSPHVGSFGHYVFLVGAICIGESKGRMNLINTYDRAQFTYGFFQLAAHTTNDNLILLLRRFVGIPEFKTLFPDLELVAGKLHTRTSSGLVNLETPDSSGNQIRLMNYLNPSRDGIDEIELQCAAKLIYLANEVSAIRFAQIAVACGITSDKFLKRYHPWYGLDGKSDITCTIIADIHHQGRAKRDEVKAALATADPNTALLKLGADKFPERIASLKATIATYKEKGWLGTKRYKSATGDFV